jgi:Zn-dependent protease
VWVVCSIVLHELAHGWTAIRCGDRTPIELGHMTINPLVHIPPMAWLMFAVAGFTWGLMPVSPSRFRGRYDDAKVSFAGPAMNLFLAVLCLVLLAAWEVAATGHWGQRMVVSDPLSANVRIFLRVGLVLNIVGFIFNLIPVPPLDGSTIARNLIPSYDEFLRREQVQGGAMIAFIALFYFGSRYIFDVGFAVADAATDFFVKTISGGAVVP